MIQKYFLFIISGKLIWKGVGGLIVVMINFIQQGLLQITAIKYKPVT